MHLNYILLIRFLALHTLNSPEPLKKNNLYAEYMVTKYCTSIVSLEIRGPSYLMHRYKNVLCEMCLRENPDLKLILQKKSSQFEIHLLYVE